MLTDLTIILPTFNEKQNLDMLIPEILRSSWGFEDERLKVIVVDDNSSDGPISILEAYRSQDARFSFILRGSEPSLPLSILEGIKASQTEYVAWLDADGSMPIKDLVRFVSSARLEELDVVVGSRFVTGGGFKGLNEVGKTTLFDFYRNLKYSQDSVVAVILSRALNELLRLILRAGVRDLTSGFLVVRRSFIEDLDFDASYGDYCPILIKRLVLRGASIREIGYICLPRFYGESKTGATLSTYIRRGLPYIFRSLGELRRVSHQK